jgi:hypothetical protein
MEKRPQIFCGGHQSGVGVRDRWDAAHCSDALEAIIQLREIGSNIAGHWAVRQVCCGLQDYSDRTVDTDRDNKNVGSLRRSGNRGHDIQRRDTRIYLPMSMWG